MYGPDVAAPARKPFPELMPWHGDAARGALAARSRWPQALLIEGPEGIGKRALAFHFARSLLCETPAPGGAACGQCASCGYVAAGQHPDLFVVEPIERDDEGNETPVEVIRIEPVRTLIEWSLLSSHRAIAKVALIVPAERMNVAAANALLKTLEEPRPGTYLMLVSHRPGRLAATVVSRCRRLALPLPPAEAALAWLARQGAPEPERLLAQAGGAPLSAAALADAAMQAERSAWLGALAKPDTLSPTGLALRVEQGGREVRRERLAAAIDWLISWTVDLARITAGDSALRNPDQAAALEPLARRVARISLFRYHRQLLRSRAVVAHPLQPRLVAEALLIDYRALFP